MIKNIILDFGGVLIPIDESKTWDAFESLGAHEDLALQTDIFKQYEIGKISSNQFLKKLQPFFFRKIFLNDIAEAWNALLSPLPEESTLFLRRLKQDYRLFLLSNTNALHISAIKHTAGPFNYSRFTHQFEKIYLSHQMGQRKPNTEIFETVLNENNLLPEETFYVDDSKQHIDSAEKLGIKTWHFNPEEDSIRGLGKVLSKHR